MKKVTKESKIKKFTPKMQASLLLVFCLIILFLVALIGRLIYLNNKDGEKYAKRVLSQQTYVSSVIPYQRGEILDRNGTELATNEKVYNLVLDPKTLLSKDTYRNPTVKAVVDSFDITEDEINQILEKKPDSQYIVLRKELTYDEVTVFNKMVEADKKKLIKGVWFEEEYKRVYPYGDLASHVLGFTTSGNVGNWGLEQYYNGELNGSNGREYGYFDSELNLERNVKQAVNGNTLVTTLDTNIQDLVQKHIDKFQKDVGSKRTAVLVMNPNNGEIYAMATSNEFDLNDPTNLGGFYTKKQISKMTEEERLNALNTIWRNFVISDTYEPGSTFKPMTVAAGYEEAVLSGNETYNCPGYAMINGERVKCSHIHGRITLKQAIEKSCNVALMGIAEKEGKELFSKYQGLFGFGEKTGIDLPGEAEGRLFNVDDIKPIDLATNSFGQNFNVNMLQIACAFSSIINGGHLYQPHLVKQIVNDKGATVKNIDATLMKETVSQKTSDILKDYLYGTVEEGTATGAQVKGVKVGGKTGTAQKYPREDRTYLVSFIGAAPIDDPEVVIYVIIDELDLDRQDQSGYATKLAGEILTDILPFLGIYPEGSTDLKSSETTSKNHTTNTNSENENQTSNENTNNNTNGSSDKANNGAENDNSDSQDSLGSTENGKTSDITNTDGLTNETGDTQEDSFPANDDILGNSEDTNQDANNPDTTNNEAGNNQ